MWATMGRSAARLTDRKSQRSPDRLAAARPARPAPLTKTELALGDGRYLLAYGRANSATDA
jgi:hypothetical protein